jgi:syntaxin 1B/2/3
MISQLMNSTRYAEGRQALREVQQRQQDIAKVEQTLAELAQLFQEVC